MTVDQSHGRSLLSLECLQAGAGCPNDINSVNSLRLLVAGADNPPAALSQSG